MNRQRPQPGQRASQGNVRLESYAIGAIPVINRFLERMQLEELLKKHLPEDDPRLQLPTTRALLVLVRNLLVSRLPIYGMGEWAAQFAPDVLDLFCDEVALLHDDRLGRCLHRLFASNGPDWILDVVRHVIREFDVSLDELHNDSTTVTFYGDYDAATKEQQRLGQLLPAITWGHNKDHRPDLKQLLYTLTITEDGGVPIYFTSSSGNVVDDQTHRETWDLLVQLVGRPDFLYVADCKLASTENLKHLACRGGRFVTVLPATRREDEQFRERARQGDVQWEQLYEHYDDEGDITESMSAVTQELVTSDGFRLLWYHSARKAGQDHVARLQRIERAMNELSQLQQRLRSPRTRFRERNKVEKAVQKILEQRKVEMWLKVTIEDQEQETYQQTKRGRPTKDTAYVRQVRVRYDIHWDIDAEAVATSMLTDGIFPLITNDRQLTAREILAAYKRQPIIEKRFSQLKTDFAVAPVYLKDVGRIQGLLASYFLALLIQTLLERELRQALAETNEVLKLYPEDRPCKRPATRRVLDVLEPIQRHLLTMPDGTQQILRTELTPTQEQLIRLLGLSPESYGY